MPTMLQIIQKELIYFLIYSHNQIRKTTFTFPENTELLQKLLIFVKQETPENCLEYPLIQFVTDKIKRFELIISNNMYYFEENIQLIEDDLWDLFQTVNAILNSRNAYHTTRLKHKIASFENHDDQYASLKHTMQQQMKTIIMLSNLPHDEIKTSIENIIDFHKPMMPIATEENANHANEFKRQPHPPVTPKPSVLERLNLFAKASVERQKSEHIQANCATM